MFTLALGKVSATVVSFAILGEPVGAMIFSMIFFGEIPERVRQEFPEQLYSDGKQEGQVKETDKNVI